MEEQLELLDQILRTKVVKVVLVVVEQVLKLGLLPLVELLMQ